MGNKIAWFFFGFLAIGIGLYPVLYGYLAYIGVDEALRSRKSVELLASVVWNIGFYTHIAFGGLALLVGWVQFSKRFRNANLKRHRLIGKVYMISVLISGVAGLYIAFYATGGIIAKLGFGSLALVWLYTTAKAYKTIKHVDVQRHEVFMIYSYAACFAAVTLRIWLPLLTIAFGDFIPAYRIVAWLCWIPNIIFAYFYVQRKGLQLAVSSRQ